MKKNYSFFSLLILLVIMGCTQPPSPMGKPLPHFDYSALTPYKIREGKVGIKKTYQAYPRLTQADFIRSPDMTVEQYAISRFETDNGIQKMVFDIQKLSMTKQKQKMSFFNSLFGNEKEIYHFELFIAMIPLNIQGRAEKPYTVQIDRKLILTPDYSIAEREFRQFEFLEKNMNDLDRAVNNIISKINR